MDISLNLIDLEYLTNRSFLKNRGSKTKVEIDTYDIDLKFYRKRIFQLTKDFLTGHYVNADLKESFSNYSSSCIKYFKFIDKADTIQAVYSPNENIKYTPSFITPLSADHLIMRSKEPAIIKIPDCMHIISTKNNKKIFLPKSLNINLKDPKFRTKGVGKKNIHNMHDEKDPKKKKIPQSKTPQKEKKEESKAS